MVQVLKRKKILRINVEEYQRDGKNTQKTNETWRWRERRKEKIKCRPALNLFLIMFSLLNKQIP